MSTTTTETPEETLARIQSMGWGKNDALAIMAFADRGIDPEQITPRQNVLTFRAWKACNRQVAKGARSVRVTVWIAKKRKDDDEAPTPPKDGENTNKSGCMWPKTTSLFHISQTIPKGAAKGTRPEAWANPALVHEGTYEAEPAKPEPAPVVPPEPPADFNPEPPVFADAECNCPMAGVVTNVDCPIHGQEARAIA